MEASGEKDEGGMEDSSGRERERERWRGNRLALRTATVRLTAGASINTQEVLSLTAPLGQSIPDAIAPGPQRAGLRQTGQRRLAAV